MEKGTAAFFYDGKSSLQQEVLLFFDSRKDCIHFVSADGTQNKWPIREILFEQIPTGLQLDFGTDFIQHIKVEDAVFISTINRFRKEKGLISWYQKLINLKASFHWSIAIAIMTLIGLCYFYFIPWVAEKSIVMIPETYDVELGNLAFEQNIWSSNPDSRKTKALNLFANELKLKNTKQLHFVVVDSEIVNAYALPNGTIVVYSGIIDGMKSYSELAGLIGHEVSHINNRDSMKMLCRNLSGYIFISTILGDANGIMAVIGDNANALQSLSFSREFEQQADIDGLRILTENELDPNGMSNLFKRLQDDSFNLSIPEFLSSHPVTKERINYINKEIKAKTYVIKDNPKLKTLFEQIKQ